MSLISGDIFGLWLSNRDLVNKLNDETVKSKQDAIISFFGGFKAMFNLCMNNQYNLDLLDQQHLFRLLSSLVTQQNNKLSTNLHDKMNDTSLALTPQDCQEEPDHSCIHSIHDICISIVFTYLPTCDHFSLLKTCKSFAIIARRKESLSPYSKRGSYCARLKTEHTLPSIMDRLTSDDEKDWCKAHESLCSLKTSHNIKKLMHSGILPLIFRRCLKSEKKLCVSFIKLIDIWLPYRNYPYHLLIKYRILKFITMIVRFQDETVISNVFDMIYSLLCSHKTSIILLNRVMLFPHLVNNMIRTKDFQNDVISQTLLILISSNSFKWNHHVNKVACRQLAKYYLSHWIKELFEDDTESLDSDSSDDDDSDNPTSICRIYEQLERKSTVDIDIKKYRKLASTSSNLSDFVHRLSNDAPFISLIIDEFDNDKDVAVRLILTMLNNKNNEEFLFNIRKQDHKKMVQKLIQSCYSSTNTNAMRCCLELSGNCNVEDKVILAQYGIASAFQDFIFHFKHSNCSDLLCNVLEALNAYAHADGCKTIVRRQLRLGKRMKQHFLENDAYDSDTVKETVRSCKLVWLNNYNDY